MEEDKKDSMSSMLDGIKLDIKVDGDIKVDVTIDNKIFRTLPPMVQREIIKRCMQPPLM